MSSVTRWFRERDRSVVAFVSVAILVVAVLAGVVVGGTATNERAHDIDLSSDDRGNDAAPPSTQPAPQPSPLGGDTEGSVASTAQASPRFSTRLGNAASSIAWSNGAAGRHAADMPGSGTAAPGANGSRPDQPAPGGSTLPIAGDVELSLSSSADWYLHPFETAEFAVTACNTGETVITIETSSGRLISLAVLDAAGKEVADDSDIIFPAFTRVTTWLPLECKEFPVRWTPTENRIGRTTAQSEFVPVPVPLGRYRLRAEIAGRQDSFYSDEFELRHTPPGVGAFDDLRLEVNLDDDVYSAGDDVVAEFAVCNDAKYRRVNLIVGAPTPVIVDDDGNVVASGGIIYPAVAGQYRQYEPGECVVSGFVWDQTGPTLDPNASQSRLEPGRYELVMSYRAFENATAATMAVAVGFELA